MEKARNCRFVLVTDVADFYNQVYHHTVENQLEKAGLPKDVVGSIKNFLNNLTQTSSRGIPIGPHAAHLMAEVTFDAIDRSLISHGYDHCRFVDDLNIFCNSLNGAEIALFDLVKILDRQQRLIIQRHKTKIITSDEFIKLSEGMLLDLPINDDEKEILKLINAHSMGGPYRTISITDLSDDELKMLDKYDFESLFESYLQVDDPNFPRIRWLYRRLAQIGMHHAVNFSINNLERLAPAISDMSKYLVSAENNFEGNWDDIGENLIASFDKVPIINHSEYLEMVVVNLFSYISDLDHIELLLQKYNHSSNIMKRKIIKAATKYGADHWLREKKEDVLSADPWLKRALMLGASTFQYDERQSWLRKFKASENLLECIIADWVIGGGSI